MRQQSLPTTTRGSQVGEHVPDSAAVKKCFEFANPDAANYLLNQLTEKLDSLNLLGKSKELVEHVKEFVANVELQYASNNKPWTGEGEIKNLLQLFQENLAAKAIKKLQDQDLGAIKMNYAVDDGHLLRSYSNNNQSLDGDNVKNLDKAFNAWLLEHNLLSQKGIIIEADDLGNARIDANDQTVKATAEKISHLMNDPKEGFAHYLQKNEVQLTTEQQPYPEQAVLAKSSSAKTEQPERREVSTNPEVEPQRDEPQASNTGMAG